jgi:hypothetical protein
MRPANAKPGRIEEIVELAEAVAGEHCPPPPVEPASIAGAQGLTLSVGDYGRCFDALLECRFGRFHIYLDVGNVASVDTPRGRFSLAHELGHFFLDEHREALRDGAAPSGRAWCAPGAERVIEREADAFAAALLMPARAFLDAARSWAGGLEAVLALGERFVVSVPASALRYAELEVRPCAVMLWTGKRLAWRRVSSPALFGPRGAGGGDVRAAHDPTPGRAIAQDGAKGTWLAGAGSVPPGSATARALAGEANGQASPAWLEAGTTASAWFAGVGPGSRGDVILNEQAIACGSGAVLTMLTRLR